MKALLLTGAAVSCLFAAYGTPARSQQVMAIAGYNCPSGTPIVNVGSNRPLVETQDANLCVQDPNQASSMAALIADTDSMTLSLTALKNATLPIAPISTVNGACNVALAVPGKFFGASGNVNGASTVFILNRASDTGDGAVLAAALLATPITVGAAGAWGFTALAPVTASAGVTVCVSSTLYSAGVLTKTNVTSTAATNNAISVQAQ